EREHREWRQVQRLRETPQVRDRIETRIVEDHLTVRVDVRAADGEPEERRTRVAGGGALPALDLEPHRGGDAVHGDVALPHEAADPVPLVVEVYDVPREQAGVWRDGVIRPLAVPARVPRLGVVCEMDELGDALREEIPD